MSGTGRVQTFDVFVGNLPPNAESGDLRRLFSKFGDVNSVFVGDDRRGGTNKVAYVRYINEEDAEQAAAEGCQLSFEPGKKLYVQRTERKNANQSRNDGNQQNKKPMWNRNQNHGGPKGDNNQRGKPNMNQSGHSANQNTQDQNKGSGNLYVPKMEGEEKILVTHIEGPCCFWAQIASVESDRVMRDITENLQTVCPSASPLTGPPQTNKVYAALYSADGLYYRCRVLDMADLQCKIQFIDYGNVEVVGQSELLDIPQGIAAIRPHCGRYVLFGLKPVYSDPSSMGFSQGVELLKKMTDGKILLAKVYPGGNGVTPVIVESETDDINQEVLNQGFGDRKFAKDYEQHSPLEPRSPRHTPAAFTGGEASGQTSFIAQDAGQVGIGFRGQMPPLGGANVSLGTADNLVQAPFSPIQNVRAPCHAGPDQNAWNMVVTMNGHGEPGHPPPQSGPSGLQQELEMVRNKNSHLQAELQNIRDNIARDRNHLQQERDAVVIELATTKGRFKSLETEYALARCQLQEASLSHQIKHLLSGICIIRTLRSQFPSDQESEDYIEVAIKLVTNRAERIELSGLGAKDKVTDCMAGYQSSQELIKECNDMSVLSDIVIERDGRRKELHTALSHFLETTAKQPHAERSTSLKGHGELKHKQYRSDVTKSVLLLMNTLKALEETYAIFLQPEVNNVLPLSEGLLIYKDWKSKKVGEFQHVRTMTNTCHNAVNSALRLIQQQLSLESLAPTDSPAACAKLDSLLQKFKTAISKEIEKTDMEHSGDSTIITMILKSLMSEMKTELDDIQRIQQLTTDFTTKMADLGQWLEKKPDITQLVALRKSIKGLKSKLRHKVADKVDLEEEDSSSNEDELLEVKSELTEIRNQLQMSFLKEDMLIGELAKLSENHFPELIKKHPELAIDKEVEFNGLVKTGRSLDQFDIKPLPHTDKKAIYKTTCWGNSAVLKEIVLDESVVRKPDFLRRALAYNHVYSGHIMPVECVFFSKNERQVYVQLPFMETNLHRLLNSGPVSEEMLYHILYGTLQGLCALHENKLVHGAIHPNNVFINQNKEGVLAEYDFSKSLKQRSENTYTSVKGLRFLAPETAADGSVTRASDIYTFGLLALWLQFPNASLCVMSSGVPDINSLSMNPSLSAMIRHLLNENPSQRPTAPELLQRGHYFQDPPHAKSPPVSDGQIAGHATLQLRPKNPSPPQVRLPGAGILKNGTPSPPPADLTPSPPPTSDRTVSQATASDRTVNQQTASGRTVNQQTASDRTSSPQPHSINSQPPVSDVTSTQPPVSGVTSTQPPVSEVTSTPPPVSGFTSTQPPVSDMAPSELLTTDSTPSTVTHDVSGTIAQASLDRSAKEYPQDKDDFTVTEEKLMASIALVEESLGEVPDVVTPPELATLLKQSLSPGKTYPPPLEANSLDGSMTETGNLNASLSALAEFSDKLSQRLAGASEETTSTEKVAPSPTENKSAVSSEGQETNAAETSPGELVNVETDIADLSVIKEEEVNTVVKENKETQPVESVVALDPSGVERDEFLERIVHVPGSSHVPQSALQEETTSSATIPPQLEDCEE